MQESVNEPSTVVQVMTVRPALRPVQTPEAFTVAISGSLEDHVTDLLVASTGATVGTIVLVFPMETVEFLGATVTPVTLTLPD